MRFESFAGLWRIERTIEDRRAGQGGRFEGHARLAPVAEGLAYREDGILRLGAAPPLRASRDYLWCRAGAQTIELRFPDGRVFHRFRTDEPAPAAEHDCPPDRYRVRYDFALWPRWRAEWRVRGPRKDYATVVAYSPAGQGAPDAASPQRTP